MEVFLEMAKGKVFPETCDCGCGLTWSCAAMNHYTLRKMLEMRDSVLVTATKLIGDRLSAAILEHIQADNDAYIKEQMGDDNGGSGGASPGQPVPPNGTAKKRALFDWSKSPVLNGLKASSKWIGSLLAL
jgi:hypothetical protein